MTVRASVSALTLAAASAVGYLAARKRSMRPAAAATILVVALAASGTLTLINEIVRSDGAF